MTSNWCTSCLLSATINQQLFIFPVSDGVTSYIIPGPDLTLTRLNHLQVKPITGGADEMRRHGMATRGYKGGPARGASQPPPHAGRRHRRAAAAPRCRPLRQPRCRTSVMIIQFALHILVHIVDFVLGLSDYLQCPHQPSSFPSNSNGTFLVLRRWETRQELSNFDINVECTSWYRKWETILDQNIHSKNVHNPGVGRTLMTWAACCP